MNRSNDIHCIYKPKISGIVQIYMITYQKRSPSGIVENPFQGSRSFRWKARKPEDGRTLFRLKAVVFCNLEELPAGMSKSGAFMPGKKLIQDIQKKLTQNSHNVSQKRIEENRWHRRESY